MLRYATVEELLGVVFSVWFTTMATSRYNKAAARTRVFCAVRAEAI
jgi:hypothetical protein